MAASQYNKECAERVFQEIGGTTWSSLQALRDCAGQTHEDRENDLLEAELRSQRGEGSTVGEVGSKTYSDFSIGNLVERKCFESCAF